MAYGVRWDANDISKCQKEAEERAVKYYGPAPHGFMYRLDDVSYSSGNEDYGYSSTLKVEITAYVIKKVTPSGWVIHYPATRFNSSRDWKFVLNGSGKRFAKITVMEALDSFVYRKNRQAAIYRSRMERAEEARDKAKGTYNDISDVVWS